MVGSWGDILGEWKNGNYYSILGSYRKNGKENGSYYSILGIHRTNGEISGSY